MVGGSSDVECRELELESEPRESTVVVAGLGSLRPDEDDDVVLVVVVAGTVDVVGLPAVVEDRGTEDR